MDKPPLGKLEVVDLREYWEDEARDFTPWMAEPENIKLLGDAVDLELEVQAQEKDVGPFRADILCKDTESSDWVLIENQLEPNQSFSSWTTPDLRGRASCGSHHLGMRAISAGASRCAGLAK
jgi:hypothetical protein